MRTLLALVGLSVGWMALGCQGTITTTDSGTTGSGTTTDSGTVTSTNSVSCPGATPENETCSQEGQSCVLNVGGCAIDLVCAGGTWKPEGSSCTKVCEGQPPDGSPCLTVGDECSVGSDCGGTQWFCSPEHVWYVTNFDDPCCYEGCECDPSFCPSAPPADNSPCDPCFDAPICEIEVETPCGAQIATASCGDDAAWHVIQPQSCGCFDHLTGEACQLDPACRYLTEGCDAPSLVKSLCVPKDDCLEVPCAPDEACGAFNAGECTEAGCVDCHEVHACLK